MSDDHDISAIIINKSPTEIFQVTKCRACCLNKNTRFNADMY